MPMTEPAAQRQIGVLFVCLGNICRSPVAEGVFRQQVEAAGLAGRFLIDSAGTSGQHRGEAPDRRSAAEAARRGLQLDHRSRRVSAADLRRFDWVLAMDRSNLAKLQQLKGASDRAKIALFRDFDPTAPPDSEVPDPYYGGPGGFAEVHDICARAAAGLLAGLIGAP